LPIQLDDLAGWNGHGNSDDILSDSELLETYRSDVAFELQFLLSIHLTLLGAPDPQFEQGQSTGLDSEPSSPSRISSSLDSASGRLKLALRFKPILIGSPIPTAAFFPQRVREYGDVLV
jgi:hypothetical protein